MHSLAYQHNTGIHPGAMINRAQPKAAPDHEKIRDAVRAWSSALDNQDVVSALIINEYERMKPTILISNQTREELAAFIGERVLDRMSDGGGCTLSFTWDSYRSKGAA